MTSPSAPHPALRHADKEIETFVQYSYARLRTHEGAVLPTEKEVRKEYQQLCWEDMSETPLKAKYFSNQVYSPNAWYFWNQQTMSEKYVAHHPHDKETFYEWRKQTRNERRNGIVQMKNDRGEQVFVPDYHLHALQDLNYGAMVNKWYNFFNKGQKLTPFKAFHIWAGIAINTFWFAEWKEKAAMISQANGSEALTRWGNRFEKFTLSIEEEVDEDSVSSPGSSVVEDLRAMLEENYVRGTEQSERSTPSTLSSSTPTPPSSPGSGAAV